MNKTGILRLGILVLLGCLALGMYCKPAMAKQIDVRYEYCFIETIDPLGPDPIIECENELTKNTGVIVSNQDWPEHARIDVFVINTGYKQAKFVASEEDHQGLEQVVYLLKPEGTEKLTYYVRDLFSVINLTDSPLRVKSQIKLQ
ncbi:hypothetical protein [Moorena sp. SIO4G3]|uniref:hypothetical protein n=1 Tax=Moorena sp. SIO4G3 TaxID=2607821 RepID=UPI00142A3EB7|nr:hypothetical protein [Moorena sp. SIO4G3]NEO81928.1 hypothetical protein [Moorena sp. SIO4G3]